MSPQKTKKPSAKSPVTGWRKVEVKKPKMVVKTGEAKRQAEQEAAQQPPTFAGVMIRLLPVWALLIMILILEPMLPVRAVGALFQWVGSLRPDPPAATQSAEPVFIVEEAQGIPVEGELPLPNWDLDIASVFTPEVQYWQDYIANWSMTYRLKPNLIATIVQIESCGDPTVVSETGAQGLFQVAPHHFEAGEDPFDPDTNARRGLEYLSGLFASVNGDLGLAFAAYNGGPSILSQSPAEWPTETQRYQFWASGIYEEAELGLQESPSLMDWLDAGGAALCAQAAEVLGLAE